MASNHRLKQLQRHLTGATSAEAKAEPANANANAMADAGFLQKALEFVGQMQLPEEDLALSEKLAGPLQHMSWEDCFSEFTKATLLGSIHLKIAEWQRKFGGDDQLAANIVIPGLMVERSPPERGRLTPPRPILEVIISNPEDCARIARVHVKKQPNFTPTTYDSIISTVNNAHWKTQREDLNPAFLPKASLGQIFPVSLARAKHAADKLMAESENGTKPVDMNEFLLYETQAQLQLALFGETEEFMEKTNKKFRNAMSGYEPFQDARLFCRDLLSRMSREEVAGPSPPGSGCPVHGPLSSRIAQMDVDQKTGEGNTMIFAFAGHDTTGHTMTWLLYELAKNPSQQKRLQKEVAEFFEAVDGREMTYEDLKLMPFMTKCIMETLRLWPAVANGTFREMQFDDYIKGANGEDVLIPKGTYVRIFNWSRHRNPELWGDDVGKFNPDREFADTEVWHHEVVRSYNPATPRFSPFTFPPRDCIGKNFAHMEARLILAHLLHRFDFELIDEYKHLDKYVESEDLLGVNYGTVAPRNLLMPETVKTPYFGLGINVRVPTGLPFKVIPRT